MHTHTFDRDGEEWLNVLARVLELDLVNADGDVRLAGERPARQQRPALDELW